MNEVHETFHYYTSAIFRFSPRENGLLGPYYLITKKSWQHARKNSLLSFVPSPKSVPKPNSRQDAAPFPVVLMDENI